jgi:hypothetical protein
MSALPPKADIRTRPHITFDAVTSVASPRWPQIRRASSFVSSFAAEKSGPFMLRIFLCQFPSNLVTQLLGQIDAGYFPAPL